MPWESILRLPRARREEREVRALAEEVLSFFGQRLAGYRWDQPAYSLSYANRRRLEIARALATRPRLLLLDEPASGLSEQELSELGSLISDVAADACVVVVEHRIDLMIATCDTIVVLDFGKVIATGPPAEVLTDPAVTTAYLGAAGDG
jgi:branched-chain amino acid transport system ATP-binding protein